MASILKVNTIQDATNSNTVATFDSSGVASIPKQAGIYEHIESIVSSSDGDIATSSVLYFNDCFSSEFLCYKLVVPYFNTTGSDGDDINIQYLTATNTTDTTSTYYRSLFTIGTNRSSYTISNATAAFGRVWGNLYPNDAGGIHGEIDFYNVHAPVINGTNTDRGSNYRPFLKTDFLGYRPQSTDGFERQMGLIRYDTSRADDYFKGFAFSFSSGTTKAGTHMSLYGLRRHA